VQIAHCDFHFARPSKEADGRLAPALPPDRRPGTAKLFNVADFGAKTGNDGDNTAAFQAALDAAGKAEGGTVYVRPARTGFAGNLTVPAAVELRGVHDRAASHHFGRLSLDDDGGPRRGERDALHHADGRGGCARLTIWYPEQDIRKIEPYPWAIRGGANCWVLDVSTSNSYQAVDFGTNRSTGHLLRYSLRRAAQTRPVCQ